MKLQRYEQDTLIKRYLLTEEETKNNEPGLGRQQSIFDIEIPKPSDNIPDPFIYKHSQWFGQPKRLFPLILAILFIFYIIQMCIGFLHDSRLSQFFLAVFALTLVAMISYISIALWCCTQKGQQQGKNRRHSVNDMKNNIMYVGSFKDT